MKIYVAGHNQDDSRKVANSLKDVGHKITSTWLEEDFKKVDSYNQEDKMSIASKDVHEVVSSDCLVLLASPYRVPGGKFVEVGAALGNNKKVYVLGHRENMLMWHPLVYQFDSVENLIRELFSK